VTHDGTHRIRLPHGQRIVRVASGASEVAFTTRDGAAELALRARQQYQLTFAGTK
jgi:hypothetical protein